MSNDNINNSPDSIVASKMGPYFTLLRNNRNYRLYLMSHCMQHTGDWFVRVAALLSVDRLAPGSATAISTIVLCKVLPEVLLTSFGGAIADKLDRKKLMILLDTVASIVALGFIVAVNSGNVTNLYIATVFRATITSIYEPATKSIVPMFVTDAEDLKCAATLNGIAWAGMLLIGGIAGGYSAAIIGVEACYALDSVTFLLSAFIMSKVTGRFSVAQESAGGMESQESDKSTDKKALMARIRSKTRRIVYPIQTFAQMSKEFMIYLWTCGFGLLVFMKSSGTLTWGSTDVLNALFANVEGDEAETSRRIGIIYSCAGLGCILGPIVANSTIVRGDKPNTLQLSCVGAFMFLILGWTGISNASSFEFICVFTIARAFGEAIIWLNSTLMLQTLTSPVMLGRMLAFEYSLARLFEAASALFAGRMEKAGYGKHEIASFSAGIGSFVLLFWSIYTLFGYGAANQRFTEFFDSGANKDHKEEPVAKKGEMA